MSEAPPRLPLEVAEQVDRYCDQFEADWHANRAVRIEDLVAAAAEPIRAELLQALVRVEIELRGKSGQSLSAAEYHRRFPAHTSLIELEVGATLDFNAPSAPTPTEMAADQRIGRYRILRLLGEGGFGRVWLGFDDELQRQVAIKVPAPARFQRPEDAEGYLTEARTVASLDHPNIVPVYDLGRTQEGSIYVVSKFIEGCSLADQIQQARPSSTAAAKLLATVAQALHYAHQKRLIHRDVKPANILIENRTDTPYVADFGLAISEENYLHEGKLAGTPAYMSPEQARGEGHRLDGRSDIFSIGVMLYELLTGTRPFRGSNLFDLLNQVMTADPVSPSELDGTIPAELERICLKALSKRASDRYTTAAELADDLSNLQRLNKPTEQLQIVPKGLRAFDTADADFFLQLLPGPRNRDGLPESIQFWKRRIEETDPDETFSVGFIYGPSGSGKSSLIKAGLLPRLSEQVNAVYVEATPDETEIRILHGLRKAAPELPADLGLVATFAALRRREGHKVVLVLDQFEQWLHGHQAKFDTDLVNAFRQCDGGQLQVVVTLRDDFWLAASRFMNAVEVEAIQGKNIALVDLFDVDHAQLVLVKFGQAFGRLPARLGDMSDEQKEFCTSVVSGLAQDGKVISVRLSLFAEMIKNKPWVPSTLAQVGGTDGIGVNFLEETFSVRTANPLHRLHQDAGRTVLRALLPEVGTDIKGHMRSRAELLAASGYQDRPQRFNELIRILDGEVRLITPTELDGIQPGSSSDASSQHYQLTHDYLVPSLRRWLTRKQNETRQGRAELLLADRAAAWAARPEDRQLPSFGQWCSIHFLTAKQHWAPQHQQLMRRANRYHSLRGTMFAVVCAVIMFAGLTVRHQVVEQRQATLAAGLVQSLLNADTAQVPHLIGQMAELRACTDPLLQAQSRDENATYRQKLYCSLALLAADPSQADYLCARLLDAEPEEISVIRDALLPYKSVLLQKLWRIVQEPAQGQEHQRLRAAAALATYDPRSDNWKQASSLVARDLVSQNPLFLGLWRQAYWPVKDVLFAPLGDIFRDHHADTVAERTHATNLLVDYAAGEPPVLADLLMDADDRQFGLVFPAFKQHQQTGPPLLFDQFVERRIAPETNWKVRFYRFESFGAFPPAYWPGVLESPVIDELEMSRLFFHSRGQMPSKKVPGEYFAAVATTEVTLEDADYQITVAFDDGVRIWLDDQVVFENWAWNHETHRTVPFAGVSGRHSIKIEYFQIDGAYVLEFDLVSHATRNERQAKRQANAATALLRLNQPDQAWPLFKHTPDPRLRSYLVHRLAPLGVDPTMVIRRLADEPDVTSRRALLLSLGEFSEQQLPVAVREAVLPDLQEIFRTEADPGLRAAAEWLLRQWQQQGWIEQTIAEVVGDQQRRDERLAEIEQQVFGNTAERQPQWYVNGQGQTMVLIPGPVEFLMGAPAIEEERRRSETQHRKRIGRTFAISAKQVTVADFRRHNPGYMPTEHYAPEPNCPILSTSWLQAAAYCNWLSQTEGIPEDQWSYDIQGQATSLKANYLGLTGYRLPTEAELEYAIRAGSLTSRSYGVAEELLGEYAWFTKNAEERSWPSGLKKPNDFGLFDGHGNCWCWCQDVYKGYPKLTDADVSEDKEDAVLLVNPISGRVLRGGSFVNIAPFLRSAYRFSAAPTTRTYIYGFRIARTHTLPTDGE